MDVSPEYIKMRLAATLDLGMGIPPKELSYFYTNEVWVDAKGDWYTSDGDEATQLERQDQLQEMVGGYWLGRLGDIFRAVRDFELTKYHCTEKEFPFTSMEQLRLAFVMKEKFNKIWDGEQWLKK